MGTDRFGSLWAWNRSTGKVTLFSPDGMAVDGPNLSADAEAVDVDREWGVAALHSGGHELVVVAPFGSHRKVLSLLNRGGDVCWLDAKTVAVSPTMAPHSAELWNTEEGKPLRGIGQEVDLLKTNNALRSRHIFLKFDSVEQILYCLESFEGALKAFSIDGNSVWSARLPHPRNAEMEAWLRSLAPRSPRPSDRGRSHPPTMIQWDGFGVDAAKNVWMVRDYDEQKRRVTFAKLAPSGPPDTHVLDGVACCSNRFVLWGNWLVLYRNPENPRQSCVEIRRW
jgi:hypothetical protein